MTTQSSNTPSYRVLIEKLTNLSQLHCIVTKQHSNLPDVQIKLRDKSTLLLQLSNISEQALIPLPVDIILDSCTIQSIPSHYGADTILRCKYTVDRTSIEDNEFPTATEFSYLQAREMYCRHCGSCLLNSDNINQCIALPSEYWNELVDMWYCHTAGPTAEQIGIDGHQIDYNSHQHPHEHTDDHTHTHTHTRPAIGNQVIQARAGKILLSQTQLLVHHNDVLKGNVKYDSNDTVTHESIDDTMYSHNTTQQYWCWLYCSKCQSLLGEIQLHTTTLQPLPQPTAQTRLYKYAVWSPAHIAIDTQTMLTTKFHVNEHTLTHTVNMFQYYKTTRCLVEQLLTTAAAHITYRFNIRSNTQTNEVLHLTIVSWDTTRKVIDLTTNTTMSPVMVPVIKCTYQVVDDIEDHSRDDCEDVMLHYTEFDALLSALNQSNATIPKSMSIMNKTNLAYLNRLTRKDFD